MVATIWEDLGLSAGGGIDPDDGERSVGEADPSGECAEDERVVKLSVLFKFGTSGLSGTGVAGGAIAAFFLDLLANLSTATCCVLIFFVKALARLSRSSSSFDSLLIRIPVEGPGDGSRFFCVSRLFSR